MQMLTMIKNQLKLLFDNRIAIFAIIAAPLLLTFLFTFSSGNNEPDLYFTDSDNSVYSRQLIRMLKAHKDINVINLSEEELVKRVDNGNITVGFVISKNFGNDLLSNDQFDVHLVENYDTGDGALLTQIVLNDINALKKATVDSKVISHNRNLPEEAVLTGLFENLSHNVKEPSSPASNTANTASAKLIGFMVMFLWFVVIQGFRTLIEEKGNQIFERIQGMPISINRYLFSKIMATYLFGLILTAIILLAGKNLFHISLIENICAEAIIFAVYLFSLTGIVMIFVPFIKKQQSFTILGSVIMALTGILGGTFFSVDEISSHTLRLVSMITPEYWGIRSITDVAFHHASIRTEILPLTVLGLSGILGFIISYIILKMKSNPFRGIRHE